MKIKKLFKIGLINTIRLNIHYFGFSSLLHPKIIAGRQLQILKLDGEVKTDDSVKTGDIQIGISGSAIFDSKYQRSQWKNSGCIHFKGKTLLGYGVRIDNSADLYFGKNVHITANTTIICHKSVKLGDNVLISWDTLIMDTDFHKIYDVEKYSGSENLEVGEKEIIIGDNVWIGCRCLLLKGCSIPSGSIVAAGSKITKKFEQNNSLLCDNKIIRNNVSWEE